MGLYRTILCSTATLICISFFKQWLVQVWNLTPIWKLYGYGLSNKGFTPVPPKSLKQPAIRYRKPLNFRYHLYDLGWCLFQPSQPSKDGEPWRFTRLWWICGRTSIMGIVERCHRMPPLNKALLILIRGWWWFKSYDFKRKTVLQPVFFDGLCVFSRFFGELQYLKPQRVSATLVWFE